MASTRIPEHIAKPAIIGLTVILLIAVLFIAFKKAFKKRKDDREQLDPFDDVEPSALSYDDVWYAQAANSIYNALNKTLGSVDEDTVFYIFNQLQNKDDYNQLVLSFDIKSDTVSAGYYMFGKPELTGNLPAWIQEQFWSSEIEEIREILQSIGVNTF